MWCDTFDADLLAVVPGVAEALGPAAEVRLLTYSRLTDGKINLPSCWNTHAGLLAFFWTDDRFRPDACYRTDEAEVACTFLEAVRDEWVHDAAISVNGRIVWRPPVNLMMQLMYDLREWIMLEHEGRERVRRQVLRSLEAAARRLAAVAGTGDEPS